MNLIEFVRGSEEWDTRVEVVASDLSDKDLIADWRLYKKSEAKEGRQATTFTWWLYLMKRGLTRHYKSTRVKKAVDEEGEVIEIRQIVME